MLNLRPYEAQDAFLIHQEIIQSLRDQERKDLLVAIERSIEEQFEVHGNVSLINSLETIAPLELSSEIKLSLRALYKSRRKKIIEIKNSVITSEDNRLNNLCQYCTINTVGPMDHIMPKEHFPEFSVHAKNLFPCCSECNSYKSEIWIRGGRRQFLNLYLDTLPQERYLFVRLSSADSVPGVEFYLENTNNLDPIFFEIISKHYENLRLLNRFSLSSNSVISDLRHTLETLPGRLTLVEIRTSVIEATEKRMTYHGPNYWKCVLELALANDEGFLNSCIN